MHTSPYTQVAPCGADTSNTAATTRKPIEQWIVNRLSECAGVDPQDIDIELPCTAYGLDSLTGLTLVGDLELWLNVRLSPTLLWEVPSIERLVQYLIDEFLTPSVDSVRVSELHQEWTAGLHISPETAKQLLLRLDQLSDQDVEAMLSHLAA